MAVKIKKIVGGLLIFLLVTLVLLLCVFFFWLGPTVELLAEQIGSKALGTPVTIQELKINPRKGTVHLTGFAIANHEMFGQTNSVSLANLELAIDVRSLLSSTVLVQNVKIDSPHFVYEQNQTTDNIAEFIYHIEEFMGIDPNLPDEHDEKPKKKSDTEKIVLVERLEINDIQLHLANTHDPSLDIDAGIKQLALSMTHGEVELHNLHISNPQRLELPDLFTLESVLVELDPDTIYSGPVSIRDVQVVKPYAYLERNRETDTAAEFIKLAESFSSNSTVPPAEEESAVPAMTEIGDEMEPPPAKALPVDLHNLLVDDIQIQLLDTTATNAVGQVRKLAGIGSIAVKLIDGRISIEGVSIANPEGYTATNLFDLARIDISLDPESIFSDQRIIEEILVQSPEINLEQTETSGNIADLTTSLMGFAHSADSAAATTNRMVNSTEVETPDPQTPKPVPVVLNALFVTNFAVNLTMPVTTNETDQGWALDASRLANLNPLDKLSLDRLKSFGFGKSSTTNEPTALAQEREDDDGPLKLVSFQLLSAYPGEGRMGIDHLKVANPHGFAYEHMIKLDRFSLELDPDTVHADTLVIREILLESPDVAFERKITEDNIKALQAEIEQIIAVQSGHPVKEEEPQDDEAPEAESQGQKVVIEHLQISGGRIRPKLSVLPAPPIPFWFEKENLGGDGEDKNMNEMVTDLGSMFYDIIVGTVANTTGFAVDALKGGGTLALDFITGRDKTDEADEAESEPAEVTPPDTKAQPRRAPTPTRRRVPGRLF